MEWREKYIADHYAGDATGFERDWADSITRARRYVVDWKDLALGANILPELEAEVHDLIERYLGYLPHISVTVEFEPYLRALIQRHRSCDISDANLKSEAIEHIKLIRNKDMEFHTCIKYDESVYTAYHTNESQYKHIVRERLTRFLGYVPNLHHSLAAEMWMWECFSHDTYKMPDEFTIADAKAITLIRYREILTKHGIARANTSPLK